MTAFACPHLFTHHQVKQQPGLDVKHDVLVPLRVLQGFAQPVAQAEQVHLGRNDATPRFDWLIGWLVGGYIYSLVGFWSRCEETKNTTKKCNNLKMTKIKIKKTTAITNQLPKINRCVSTTHHRQLNKNPNINTYIITDKCRKPSFALFAASFAFLASSAVLFATFARY